MASATQKPTKIVMMSPELMRMYDVQAFEDLDVQALTFYNPEECLDMMVEAEEDPNDPENFKTPEKKAERLERQWGELELRLSFFIEGHNWQ